jgi:YHS domain-containing protein
MPGYEASVEKGKVCVVCGGPIDTALAVIEQERNGHKVSICSQECLAEYYKDPEKYFETTDEDED